MLATIATVLWIVLGFGVSLVTAPILPPWEWWTILSGGMGLGVLALIGQLLDRKNHKKEIDGLNTQLLDVKSGQTFQSGQLNALAQLIGQEAINKFAEAMRIPITEVAREFMPSLQATLSQERALQEENERLTAENNQLRERPTAGLAVGASATIVRRPITVDPRVRALYQAVVSYEGIIGEEVPKVSDTVSTTVTKGNTPRE